MLPLKIAVLWHQHQPYYLKDEEFILPWVRLHGIKDYYDLAELLNEFPDIKQTFNLVPSLMVQIEDYIKGKYSDKIQKLSALNASHLNKDEKRDILKNFFLCNIETMLNPYPRYKELYEAANNHDEAIKKFSSQDWLDLQVWYNLTWFGQFSRQHSAAKRLFIKQRNFTEEEKVVLLNLQMDVLSKIIPLYKDLQNLKQIEVSVTPYYHPILPLLCDNRSALEAMPELQLFEPNFKHPEDAEYHVEKAIELYENSFNCKPVGMWPSEGSISNEVLDLLAKAGIKWIASDEQVLFESTKNKYNELDKFFPRKYKSKDGEIAMLFRDHNLSDAIGFIYSRWNSFDAANDFCSKLRHIKSQIVNKYGENALHHAVVPIILDGENCWEFYPDNGLPFLRELYKLLSHTNDFQTITMSEALTPKALDFLPIVNNIRAGSWINADFNIWIGDIENRIAWQMLSTVRNKLEEMKPAISKEKYQLAMEEIYIAEGSDWFWWYGDAHQAPNKADFDVLFRWHVENVYKILELPVPDELHLPISKQKQILSFVQQSAQVDEKFRENIENDESWKNAGCFDAKAAMSSMHQIGEILDKIYFASDEKTIYFRIDYNNKITDDDLINLEFIRPNKTTFSCGSNSMEIIQDKPASLNNLFYSKKKKGRIYLAVSKSFLHNDSDKNKIELLIRTKSSNSEIIYPRQGTLCIFL